MGVMAYCRFRHEALIVKISGPDNAHSHTLLVFIYVLLLFLADRQDYAKCLLGVLSPGWTGGGQTLYLNVYFLHSVRHVIFVFNLISNLFYLVFANKPPFYVC